MPSLPSTVTVMANSSTETQPNRKKNCLCAFFKNKRLALQKASQCRRRDCKVSPLQPPSDTEPPGPQPGPSTDNLQLGLSSFESLAVDDQTDLQSGPSGLRSRAVDDQRDVQPGPSSNKLTNFAENNQEPAEETQPNRKKNSLCAFFKNKWLALQKANQCRRRGGKVSPLQPPSDTEPPGPQPGPSTDDLQLDLSSNKTTNFEANRATAEPAEETQPNRKKKSLCEFFKKKWLALQKANQCRRRGNKVSLLQPPSDTEPVGPQPGPSNLKTTSAEDQHDLQSALSSFGSLAVDDQADLQSCLSGLEPLAVDIQAEPQLGLSSFEPLAVDDQADLQSSPSSFEPLAVEDQAELQSSTSSLESLAVEDQADLQSSPSSLESLAVEDQADLQSSPSSLKSLAVEDQADLHSSPFTLEPLAVDDQTDLKLGLSSFESLAVDDQADLQSSPSSLEPLAVDDQADLQSSPSSLEPLAVDDQAELQLGLSSLEPLAVDDQTDLKLGLSSFESLAVDDQADLQSSPSSLEPLAVDDQLDLKLGLSSFEPQAVDDQTDLKLSLSSFEPQAVDDQTDLQLGLSSFEPLAVDDQTDLKLGLSSFEPLAVDDQTDLKLGQSSFESLAVDDQTDLQLGLSGLKSLVVVDQSDLYPGLSSNKSANSDPKPANPEPDEEKTTDVEKNRINTFFNKTRQTVKPVLKKNNVVNPRPDTGSAAAEPNPHTSEPDPPASEPEPPIPEPDSLIPEPEPPIPEPDSLIPEPDSPIPEPEPPVPKPDSPIPEQVVRFHLQDQTDNSSDKESSDEESSEDSQPCSSKFVRAPTKHRRIGDKSWLRTIASPGPNILPFSAVYEVGEKLGEGGFGEVFVGLHKLNQQHVAIKFVKKTRADRYIRIPGLSKPLLAEVSLNLLLNQQPISPYIVHMIDWFDEEQRYILIMEYPQPCVNLLSFITQNKTKSESEARSILYQVVLGCKHCLDRGIFHRDIKLNNCVINTETHQVKLIDFGCGDLLKSVYVGGFTGGCCPPEYVATLAYRADPTTAWSLGYLMYKLMCGTYPFKSLEDMKTNSLTFPLGLSREFQDLISGCLITDPNKRSTVDDILNHEWFQQMPAAGVSGLWLEGHLMCKRNDGIVWHIQKAPDTVWETQPNRKKNCLCAFFKNKRLALQKANQCRRRDCKVSPLQPPSDTEPPGPQPGPSTDNLQLGLSSFESLAVDDQTDLQSGPSGLRSRAVDDQRDVQPGPSSNKLTNFEENNPEPAEETQPNRKKNSLCAFFKNKWLALHKANQCRRRGGKVSPLQPPSDTEPPGPQPGPSTDDLQLGFSSNKTTNFGANRATAEPAEETQPNRKKKSLCEFFKKKWLALQKANQCRRRGNEVSLLQPPSDTEPVGPQPGPSNLKTTSAEDQHDLQSALSSFGSLAVDDQADLQSCLSGLEPLAVDIQAEPQLGLSSFEPLAVGDQADLQSSPFSLEPLAVDDQAELQLGLSGLEPLAVDDQTDLKLGLSSFEPLAVDDQTDLKLGLSSFEPLAVDDQTDLKLGLSSFESLAVDDQTDLQLGLSGLKSLVVVDQSDLYPGLSSNKPANSDPKPDNPEPDEEKTTDVEKNRINTFFNKTWQTVKPVLKKNNVVNPRPDTVSAAAEPNPHTSEPNPPASEPESPIPEPDSLIPEPEPPIPEPDSLIPKPDLPIPEPDSPIPEPDSPIPEPEPPASEPELPIPEPDLPIPEPDSLIPEPDSPILEPEPPIPKPDSPIPEQVVQIHLQDQTDNSSDKESSDEESSEDSQPCLSKFVRAPTKHRRIGDKSWLRTIASPGPNILPFSAVYEVGEKLGEGGFGEVFVGLHKLNQQQVAIKFVKKTRADRYIRIPGLSKPLLAEVSLNLLLNQQPISPYIVHMIDWFDEEQRYILIMEYPQPCVNLLSFITQNKTKSESEARSILYQVVLGCKHCLDRGIFHRDIKLNNCVINTETHQVKLIDFGCGDLLKSVYVGGFTGGCCPPEYVATLAYRADPTTAWSLGYLMYKLMCGTYPFKSLEDMKTNSLTFPLGLSREFQDLISGCLITDPNKRSTVDDILNHEWFQQMPAAGVSTTCTKRT
ncbi:uncharacterized protein [Danio rerio]|uniref:Uncharacterized protein n=1 Tax=Danio rerio TaxID=7955 RepID=A0AB32TAM5_DANRE